MSRISATIGYRNETKINTTYFAGESNEGYCYKDRDAFENDEDEVCFIRENIFRFNTQNERTITSTELAEIDDIYTRKQMREWVEDYVKSAPMPFRNDGFIDHIVEVIFDELDWCGFDMYLDDLDMDEELISYSMDLLDKMNVPRNSYSEECLIDFLCESGKGLEDSLDEFSNLKPI